MYVRRCNESTGSLVCPAKAGIAMSAKEGSKVDESSKEFASSSRPLIKQLLSCPSHFGGHMSRRLRVYSVD
jgi:dsDNA-specific endonuclease/ATPase MutS2